MNCISSNVSLLTNTHTVSCPSREKVVEVFELVPNPSRITHIVKSSNQLKHCFICVFNIVENRAKIRLYGI